MKRARGWRRWLLLALALAAAGWAIGYYFFWREPHVPADSCLEIVLPYDFSDRALPALIPGGEEAPALLSARRLLRRARGDPRITAVLIRLGAQGVSPGRVYEASDLIIELTAAGKAVTVHAPRYDLAAWAVASHARTISLAPLGVVDLRAPRAMLPFFAGALAELGVAADFVRHGDDKALFEQFTRAEPSDALRDQWQNLCDRLAGEIRGAASPARDRNSAALERAAAAGTLGAAQALADGWIDVIEDSGELEQRLLASEDRAFVTRAVYREVPDERGALDGAPAIAILSIEGALLAGESYDVPLLGRVQGFDELRRAVAEIGSTPSLQGVIVRIESPGGDVQVAEAVWREIDRLELPVVALLGTQATSGGYYVATACSEIYCSPATVLGAIGVIGGHWVLAGAASKLGVQPHLAAARADSAPSCWQVYSAEQRALVSNELREIYDAFVERVRVGRRLDRLTALAAANGRLYVGREAAALGLVDGDGGWSEAWRAICELAEIEDPARASFEVFPRGASWWDRLWEGKIADPPRFPEDLRAVLAAGAEARWYLGPIVVGLK